MEELDFIIYGVKNKYNRKYKRMESSINNEIAARNKFLGQLEGVLKELMGQRKTLTNADMLDIEIKEIEPAIDEIEREIGVQKLELSELEERKSKIVFKEGVIPPPPLQPPSNTTLPGNIPVEPLLEDKKINLGQENLPREDDDEDEEDRDYTEKDLVECLRRIIGFGWVNYIKSYTYDRELELNIKRARGKEEDESIDLPRIQRVELESEFSNLDTEIEKYSKLSKEGIETRRGERKEIGDKIKKLSKISEGISEWLSSSSSEVVEIYEYQLNDIKIKINKLRRKLKEELGISIASTPKGIKDLKSSEVTGLIDERIATLFLRYLRTDYAKDHPEEFDIYIRNSNDEDIIREICNDRENKILVWYREGVEKIIDLIVKNKQYYFCRLYLELKEMTKLLEEGDPEDRLKLEGSITRGIIRFEKSFNRFFDDIKYPVKLIEETEKKIKDARKFIEYVYGLVSKVKGFYTGIEKINSSDAIDTFLNEIKNIPIESIGKKFTKGDKDKYIAIIDGILGKDKPKYISGLKELEEALLESQQLRFSIRALKELELEEKRYREEIVKFSTSTYQNLRLLEQIGRDIQEKVKSIRRSVQVYGKFVPNNDNEYIETKFLEKVMEILEINVGKIPELKSRFLDYGVTDSDPKRREEKRTKLKESFITRLNKYKSIILGTEEKEGIIQLIIRIFQNVGISKQGINNNELIDLLFKYTDIGSPDECEELISGETEKKEAVTVLQKYLRGLLGRRELKRLQEKAAEAGEGTGAAEDEAAKAPAETATKEAAVEVEAKAEAEATEEATAAEAEKAASEAGEAEAGEGTGAAGAAAKATTTGELSQDTTVLWEKIKEEVSEKEDKKIKKASEAASKASKAAEAAEAEAAAARAAARAAEAEAEAASKAAEAEAEAAKAAKAEAAKGTVFNAKANAVARAAADKAKAAKAAEAIAKAAVDKAAAEAIAKAAAEAIAKAAAEAEKAAAEAEKAAAEAEKAAAENFCDTFQNLNQKYFLEKERVPYILNVLSDLIEQGCDNNNINNVIIFLMNTIKQQKKGRRKGTNYDFSMLKPWLGNPENERRAAKIYERMINPLGKDKKVFGNFGKEFIKLYEKEKEEDTGGGAKSPLKLKNPKSKYLSPTSKIKKERKKKKDKINKLKNKKNIKKGEPKK